MPSLICKLDGISAILFHVEHSEGEAWQYRWRIVGPYPPPYLVWREATTSDRHVQIVSEIRDCSLEVEWRSTDLHEWGQVALLELDYPRAVFSIRADAVFSAPDGFIACASIRDEGVAAYRFPRLELDAGFEGRCIAHGDAPAWANVLLTPGEFRPVIDGLTITNVSPSENAWRKIPHSGPFPLTRCPLGQSRRWWAVAGAPVPLELPEHSPIMP